jgi:uncharacterized DUF497 family protein
MGTSGSTASPLKKHGRSSRTKRRSSFPTRSNSVREERFVLLGLSSALRVLVVVYCEREGGDAIRIISARKADAEEHRLYADRRAP